MGFETVNILFQSGLRYTIRGKPGLYKRLGDAISDPRRHTFSETGFSIRNLDHIDMAILED